MNSDSTKLVDIKMKCSYSCSALAAAACANQCTLQVNYEFVGIISISGLFLQRFHGHGFENSLLLVVGQYVDGIVMYASGRQDYYRVPVSLPRLCCGICLRRLLAIYQRKPMYT